MGNSAPGTVVMFWDYDTQWGADRSRSGRGPAAWGPDEFTCTEELLELHAEYDVAACFAVVGAAAQRGDRPYHDPAQVRAIHGAGHEVASHALRHEWLPGVGRTGLYETLRQSRDLLEQCIGAHVTTFVPPYNQPFDCPERLAFSLSERRAVRRDRIDLRRLCETLVETGYRMARVTYRPLPQQLLERVFRRQVERPVSVRRLGGLRYLRLNTFGGFDGSNRAMLERCAREGGIAVVYGHPHSLHAGNSQDRRHLVPLLGRIAELRSAGRLCVRLPREFA